MPREIVPRPLKGVYRLRAQKFNPYLRENSRTRRLLFEVVSRMIVD
jgi:hypothetical protein